MKRKGREVSWPFYSFLLSLIKEESLFRPFKTFIKELHNNMREKMKIIGIIFSILMIINLQSVDPFYDHLSQSLVPHNNLTVYIGMNWIETQKILSSDGAPYDYFGISVALSGNTALIGASYDESLRGSAYIFTFNGTIWTQQIKLSASDGVTQDYFGYPVCLDGNIALIGAPGDDTGRGSAYVFLRNGTEWTQEVKLVASDGAYMDRFGMVSLSGDIALIGAPWDDDNGYNSGSAYVFTWNGTNWTQQAKLRASDGVMGDSFGQSVAISGDTAIIGAPWDDNNGPNSGSAYVFTCNGTDWTQQAKLYAQDGSSEDEFGFPVSIDGDTVLIGASHNDDNGDNSGSVYVFIRIGATWFQQAKLCPSDGASGDIFGWSVSLDGDTALIGAYYDDLGRGSAYIFTRDGTTWIQQVKLLASDRTAGDYFGNSVSIVNNTALIAAGQDDDNGVNSGSVYIFTKENQPPTSPIIDGSTDGKVKQQYNYSFMSADPGNNDVYYFIDWGDETNSNWIGPYPSGTAVTQSHTWATKGTYIIKAKAKNTLGMESDWGTLTVTMPVAYEPPHFQFLEWLFEHFPHAFPILRYFFGWNI
jgi:hypothetical protein